MDREEKIRKIQGAMMESGIEAQAFINGGRVVEDPIDAMHFWVIEEEYIFSLYLCGKLAALADAMDTCGKVSMHMPDLYCWRMPLDEEVLRLIDSIKE